MWRTIARSVIAEALMGTEGMEAAEVIKKIDAAYPFGECEHWPYKVWLEERRMVIARLRGEPPLTTTSPTRNRANLLPPPYVPDPELEAWLRNHGRAGVAHG